MGRAGRGRSRRRAGARVVRRFLARRALARGDGRGRAPRRRRRAATPDGAALSFATDVYPLLVPTCQSCHATGQQAGDTQLLFTGDAPADYPTVIMFVDTSAPAGSRLLSKLSGNGHQGGTVYAAGSPEYQTILHWIEQGALP